MIEARGIDNLEGQCPFCGSSFVAMRGPKGFGIVHEKPACKEFETCEPLAYLQLVIKTVLAHRATLDALAKARENAMPSTSGGLRGVGIRFASAILTSMLPSKGTLT